MQYNQFRSTEDSEEQSTRKCIEYVIDSQQNLLHHMLPAEHLLSRIRDIFCPLPWCETLYHRISIHDDATSLSQRLISAVASEDIRRKRQFEEPNRSYFSSSFTVRHPKTFSSPPSTSELASLVYFFSKTPSPPLHHCPLRYHKSHFFRRLPSHSRFRSRRLPSLL